MSGAGTSVSRVAAARSLLFVPGDRPERFGKAVVAGPDLVIVDLEDAVDSTRKSDARGHLARWLPESPGVVVRINGVQTDEYAADCDLLAGLADTGRLLAVMLAKAESAAEVAGTAERLDVPVIPLVESALGMSQVSALCAAPGAARLAFGSVDYCADLGIAEDRTALLTARCSLVLASRVAGLPAPIDGVSVALTDAGAVADDARHSVSLGFSGKLCVHPAQVPAVHDAVRPSEDQLRWARSVLSDDAGARQVDGRMVDRAVLAHAGRLLAAATPADAR